MKRSTTVVTLSILWGTLVMGCNAIIDVAEGIPYPADPNDGGQGGHPAEETSSSSSTSSGGVAGGNGGTGGMSVSSSSSGSTSSGMGAGGSAGEGGSGEGNAGGGGSGGAGMPPVCVPGSTQPCYSGPSGTEGIGACHAGVQICNVEGTALGDCVNEVTPVPEDCATAADDDCNGVANDMGITPTMVSPTPGQTLAGGSITFQWTGGTAPYLLEIAFDAAFTKPAIAPISTSNQSVTVDGLNGGYLYWRVSGKGECGNGPPAQASELHLTCKPVLLRSDPVFTFSQASVAWNAKDGEYGVAYNRKENDITYIEFLRTNRFGKVIGSPKKLESPLMPTIGTGYFTPDLVYMPSNDRWAVAYHREGIDESHVTLFDDNGNVIANRSLDFGGDTEAHNVSYHPDIKRLVTSTDHGGSAWETYVEQFDMALQKIGSSVNTGLSCGAPNNGSPGSTIALPGLLGANPSALAAFDFRESISPDVHHLFVQRVDLKTGALAWPKGTSFPCFAGKKIVPNASNGQTFFLTMDWNPKNQNVGIVYAHHNFSASWGPVDNVYFALIDPINGQLLTPKVVLNAAAPQRAHTGMPKVAWDGEEYLVMWNDGRDVDFPRQLRMTKFDGNGQVIGGGDRLFAQSSKNNVVQNWTGKGVVGHDRIHTFAEARWEDASTPASIWMCVEPPY